MAFADPERIVKEFGLHEGQVVVDFGCGPGHLMIPAARAVGDGGHVYGVEIQPYLARKAMNSARELGFGNIDVIVADMERPSGTKLKSGIADAAIFSNVLYQLENREAAAEEAARVLSPKGKLLVVDWTDSFGGIGPRPEDVFKEEAARNLFEKRGFEVKRSITAGDHHYGIVLVRHG